MAKECRPPVRGIDEHKEEEVISWACMIDAEVSDLNAAGESEPIPEKLVAEREMIREQSPR